MKKGQRVQRFDVGEPFRHELSLPEGPGPFPLLCITPILGQLAFLEDFFLERRFARFFSEKGFACALIHRPIFEFDSARDLHQIQNYLEESVARNKKVLDSLLARKEIDATKIGTYGISFGAVVNSLWAAEDPRLKAHLFALGGGNLPEIFLTSRDPLMRSHLAAITKKTGVDKNRLKALLREVLRSDPLDAARSISGENVCLHLALFDRVIRLRYGLAFRRALGNPETVFIPLGHYSSILSVPFLKHQALDFFRRKLNLISAAS